METYKEVTIESTVFLAENYIINLLESLALSQLWHWQTKSLGEHKALEEYYTEVRSKLDSFVEQYQGTRGASYRLDSKRQIELAHIQDVDLLIYFEKLLEDTDEVSSQTSKFRILSHLTSQLDDLKSIISKTTYLLSLK